MTAENRQRFQRYLAEYSEVFGARRAQDMLERDFRASEAASSVLPRFADLVRDLRR